MSASPEASAEQAHPLEASDRDLVDGLLAATTPSDEQLVDAARLLIRYDGFPGAVALKADLEKVIKLWKLSRDQLNARVQQLWAAGTGLGKAVRWRPGVAAALMRRTLNRRLRPIGSRATDF